MLNLFVKRGYNGSIAFHTSNQNLEFMSNVRNQTVILCETINCVSLAPSQFYLEILFSIPHFLPISWIVTASNVCFTVIFPTLCIFLAFNLDCETSGLFSLLYFLTLSVHDKYVLMTHSISKRLKNIILQV